MIARFIRIVSWAD